MTPPIYVEDVESEADTCASDDSQDDPSFDVLEETQSRFSDLSIQKKSKSRILVKVVEDVDCVEIPVPEFDANDQKSYETVQKIIEVGQVEKLKVDQCKLYLRKHGLRLTGKKDVLIDRIKEHIRIMNGEGEHKYPASSFVMNCKGDACTGDIVMFEQNVYEMFSIVSRSATGPPCGTRVVAGRIVKESYGAAKQQHTFTVEVLWSKGVKPLPPLHPLLIKGRNLYRLKTMRQRWEDEGERRKILCEKHDRGNAARTNREARIQEKERRKALRENRASSKGNNIQNQNQEKKRKTSPTCPINTTIQHAHAGGPLFVKMNNNNNHQGDSYKENVNSNFVRSPVRREQQYHAGGPLFVRMNNKNNNQQRDSYKENVNSNIVRSPIRRERQQYDHFRDACEGGQNMDLLYPSRRFERASVYHPMSQSSSYDNQQRSSAYHPYDNNQQGASVYHSSRSYNNNGYLATGHYEGLRMQQPCKFYAQGRCTYGTNCKFLH